MYPLNLSSCPRKSLPSAETLIPLVLELCDSSLLGPGPGTLSRRLLVQFGVVVQAGTSALSALGPKCPYSPRGRFSWFSKGEKHNMGENLNIMNANPASTPPTNEAITIPA